MLAQLYYPANTNLLNALNDMIAVLSGTTDVSALSAALDKTKSEVVADKKQTDWTLAGRLGMAAETSGGWGNERICSAVLTRPCTTKPGSNKYIRLRFGGGGTFAGLQCAIGRGVASNDLSQPAMVVASSGSLSIPVVSAGAVATSPIRITIYGSDTAVMIALAVTDLMQPSFVGAFLEMENKWSQFSANGGNIPHILCSNDYYTDAPSLANNGSKTNTLDKFVSAPMTINGVTFGSVVTASAGAKSAFSRFGFCTPEVSITNAMYRDADKKFSGFLDKGTKYDLYSFGTNNNDRIQYNNSNVSTSPSASEMFPYSSITDVTGVYLINQHAFGRDGSYFNTPVGTMCKFGMFMVEVG